MAAAEGEKFYPELETIVTLFCDEGEKYISDHFADKNKVRLTSENYT